MNWHAIPLSQVLDRLGTGVRGLSQTQAKQRLGQYGPNELKQPRREGLLLRIAKQLRDPMILVLLGAAALSLLAGGGKDWLDALIILLIVAVNSAISIFQEDNAQRALEALKKMSAPRARVLREGQITSVEAALLVPGDVIVLEAGDRVPADGRLLDCAGLRVDESAMTGESVPVEKALADHLQEETPLGDRCNMVTAATLVTAGTGRAVVVATGMDTRMGQVADLLHRGEGTLTPLQQKMGEISRVLSVLCVGVCVVLFGVGVLRGRSLPDMFLTAVCLAVAAIPEGLPAIVSMVLAMGVGRMARRGAIMKKLPAVETLGCAQVICSDKTGTLTQNRMTVTRLWTPGQDHGPALTACALCSEAKLTPGKPLKAQGDPTEAALVVAAAERDFSQQELEEKLPRVGQVPFDSARKLMTTVHKKPSGGFRILVKGAPDVLLERCSRVWTDREEALDGAMRARIRAENEEMAGRALRVLGTAFRDTDRLPKMTAEELERDLTFSGLLGMMDPPRPEAKQAVARCIRAGIRPVMITGDHRATAVAVARELNIFRDGDLALTGADLDLMPQQVLQAEIDRCRVFARVTPEHKMRIIRAWQERGQVTAMTGDGVNDAPALKAADIGCAMGIAGTDVARSAADMVLTDDNFATVVRAVEEGRGIYGNIRRAIHYLLSCNIGEMLTVCTATALGLGQMPLLPVQLLWLNLVTDSLPALALGVEPAGEDLMDRPPRGAGERLFDKKFSFRIGWQGLMVGGLAMLAYYLGLAVMPTAWGGGETANTMAFATLTLCQLFHAFNVRGDCSLFRLGVTSNPAMNRAFLAGFVMQLAVLGLPPLQNVFSVIPLGPAQWLTVLALSVTPVAVCEAEKKLAKKN